MSYFGPGEVTEADSIGCSEWQTLYKEVVLVCPSGLYPYRREYSDGYVVYGCSYTDL